MRFQPRNDSPPGFPTWTQDGSRLAFLWDGEGGTRRDVWIADRGAESPRRVTAPPHARFAEIVWSPSAMSLIVADEMALNELDVGGGQLNALTPAGAPKIALSFSPDSRYLSFLESGDIWLLDRETEELERATQIGLPPIGTVPGARYFRPDMECSSYSWSPTGKHIALQIDDRRAVRQVRIPNYLGKETTCNSLRRDFPGDNDHVRAVAIYTVVSGELRTVALPEPTNRRILGFSWAPNGRVLLVDQTSESREHRWLYLVTADDGQFTELYHEYRPGRTTAYWTSEWRRDGSAILMVAELDGRHHLYSLSIENGDTAQLTSGNWDILGSSRSPSPLVVSRTAGIAFFLASISGVHDRVACRIAETGGQVTPVTQLLGTQMPFPSPAGDRVAILHADDVTPPELHLVDLGDTPMARRIARSAPRHDQGRWIRPRYITFSSHVDGALLHGRLLEAPHLDTGRRHPVIMGPVYHDTVRNDWRGLTSLFQQHLALDKGYIVFQVDVRGSTGHGREHIERLRLNYGEIDVEDLEAGVRFLATLPHVDLERIGIWGTSYGGLLVLMSLFKKPGLYGAGVAAAPASNLWHATTGEVANAGRPSTHPESYRRSSALSFGEALVDPLMIIHGMQDDVVLFQDSVALVEKLLRLGKQLDFVIAPAATHDWANRPDYAAFFFEKIEEHFDRHLDGCSS